jgi:hypothetical protein
LKEKTLLKGVTPSLLLYYVLGNHAFEKKAINLKKLKVKGGICLEPLFYLHIS